MLAEKLERAGDDAGANVRGMVRELSRRLGDLRETAPMAASVRPQPAPEHASSSRAAQGSPCESDLTLVKAAIDAERQRALQLRGEIDEFIAQVSLLDEESRRVAQLRADRDQWAARARAAATAVL